MTRLSLLTCVAIQFVVWLLSSASNLEAAEPTQHVLRGAFSATQCTRAAECPLLDEVYAATPAFRHALALNLRHGGNKVPDWVKSRLGGAAHDASSASASASAMLPLLIDERPYIMGRMTDPDFPAHRLVVLYDTQRGFATIHYVSKDGLPKLLGDTTEILRKVMIDYLNDNSSFSQALAHPDVALPIPVTSH